MTVPTTAPGRRSTAGKLRLVVEIGRTYVTARRLLRRGDLPAAVGELRAGAVTVDTDDTDDVTAFEARRLGRAVSRTLSVIPADSRCLLRALTLVGLLARRGVAGTLVIGVRPGADFGAHAWVELDGQPLLPSNEADFARLVAI